MQGAGNDRESDRGKARAPNLLTVQLTHAEWFVRPKGRSDEMLLVILLLKLIPPMQEFWISALDHLKTMFSEDNFDRWFQYLSFHHHDDGTYYLATTDGFYGCWIKDNYLDLIEEALAEATGQPVDAIEVVIDVAEAYEEAGEERRIDLDEPRKAAREARLGQEAQGALFEMPSEEVEVDLKPLSERVELARMNPRYIFDEFVVGPSNQFTYAASRAVATEPAKTYNPLFIFGGVGLGKTHLLQAIGIEMLRRDPTADVVYLSAEEFMNQMITSLRNQEMNAFRDQFRNNCDLLLVDDIQFIGGKDSTQEEFFHTFNALYQSGKQLVVTSDKTPQELPGIEERLASRFAWGLIADIQPPEIETRVAILEQKAEADDIEMSQDVAMLLASSIRSNVRELEGTLIRLGAQADLMGTSLTVDFVRQMLKRMNIRQRKKVGVDEIMRTVSSHFDITVADMKGRRRTRAISEPRQIAMYLARFHTDHSYPELGRYFGGKDHTTVLAAFQKLEGLVEMGDNDFARHIEDLERVLFG